LENMRGFTIKNYYMADINHVKDSENKRWSWDIYIAANDNEEYRGKALAPGKGVEIPWTPLVEKDFLEEMMAICEQVMPKHP
jgi:hypothetical protein